MSHLSQPINTAACNHFYKHPDSSGTCGNCMFPRSSHKKDSSEFFYARMNQMIAAGDAWRAGNCAKRLVVIARAA
ncbi:MAG TPA: hypothetical protein VK638_35835 [Edaphobacter sp.]|nr:hypothetical protein [Edaphobacter sp.]